MATDLAKLQHDCLVRAPSWFQGSIFDVAADGTAAFGSRGHLILLDMSTGQFGGTAFVGKALTSVRWIAGGGDGGTVVTGSERAVKFWGVGKGRVRALHTASIPGDVLAVAVSPQTSWAAAGDNKGTVHFFPLSPSGCPSGPQVSLSISPKPITALSYNGETGGLSLLAVGTQDGGVALLRDDQTKLWHWVEPHKGAIHSLSWRQPVDGDTIQYLTSASADRKVVVWRITPSSYQSNLLPDIESEGGRKGTGQGHVWRMTAWGSAKGQRSLLFVSASTAIVMWNLSEMIDEWSASGHPPGKPKGSPLVISTSRIPFTLNFFEDAKGAVVLVSSTMAQRIITWDVSRLSDAPSHIAENAPPKQLWQMPCFTTPPLGLAVDGVGNLAVGEKEVLLWHLPAAHQGKGKVSNPYHHRTHWSKVTGTVTEITFCESVEVPPNAVTPFAFGTQDGQVGTSADLFGKAKGKGACIVAAHAGKGAITALLFVHLDDLTLFSFTSSGSCTATTASGGRDMTPEINVKGIAKDVLCAHYCDGLVALARGHGGITVHSAKDLALVTKVALPSPQLCNVAVGKGKKVAACDTEGTVYLLTLGDDGKDPEVLWAKAHSKGQNWVGWTGEGSLVSIGSSKIVVWDTEPLRSRASIKADLPRVRRFVESRGVAYILCESHLIAQPLGNATPDTGHHGMLLGSSSEKSRPTSSSSGEPVPAGPLTLKASRIDSMLWVGTGQQHDNIPFLTGAMRGQVKGMPWGERELLVESLMLRKGARGEGEASVPRRVAEGVVLGECEEDLLRVEAEGEAGPLLHLLLRGNVLDAVHTAPSPTLPFWTGLSRRAGHGVWERYLRDWVGRLPPHDKRRSLTHLAMGDVDEALAELVAAGDYRAAVLVSKRFGTPLDAGALAAAGRKRLRDDDVVGWSALAKIKRDKMTEDKAAEAALKHAVAWLRGDADGVPAFAGAVGLRRALGLLHSGRKVDRSALEGLTCQAVLDFATAAPLPPEYQALACGVVAVLTDPPSAPAGMCRARAIEDLGKMSDGLDMDMHAIPQGPSPPPAKECLQRCSE